MGDDLVERLRALSRGEHDDLSVGDEAADRIEELEMFKDVEKQKRRMAELADRLNRKYRIGKYRTCE